MTEQYDRERVSEREREIEREGEGERETETEGGRHKDLEMRRSGRHKRARECTHTRKKISQSTGFKQRCIVITKKDKAHVVMTYTYRIRRRIGWYSRHW